MAFRQIIEGVRLIIRLFTIARVVVVAVDDLSTGQALGLKDDEVDLVFTIGDSRFLSKLEV